MPAVSYLVLMAYPSQATTSDVTAAGLVRLTGLAARYLYLKANYQPVDEVVLKGIDLRQKIEAMAVTADLVQQGVFLRYLGETYDLPEGVYTDPVEHAKLPPVPATGAQVRPIVLRIQDGKALRIQGGKALGIGYRLVPAPVADPVAPVVADPKPATDAPADASPTPLTMPITQAFTKQTVVTVQHNLGRQVNVIVFDNSNNEIEGSISSTPNSVTVSFSEPVSGTLYIS